MLDSIRNPFFRPSSILLMALSLSIGWGIRGDFGHEAGAWIPGALTAIAACLLSQREDWRSRVGYCALFGGLGWGFGGSIAYMYTLSFANSGQWQTTWYGYFAVFLVGGLWAGVGAAGTVLPLCINRDRLTSLFVPFCFVLTAMIVNQFLEEPLTEFLKPTDTVGLDRTWGRHKSPLYWFDADWLPALWALIGVCAYDLWNRRFAKFWQLLLLASLGAAAGFALQFLCDITHLTSLLVNVLVVPLGDTTAISPETGTLFERDNLMVNWPQFFGDYPGHIGWWLGLTLGIGIYFYRNGTWKNDSKLFLYLALGWWIAFLAMPVFGSIPFQSFGGFRLTPPRGDNWAGVIGVLGGICLYGLRHDLAPVSYAGLLNFFMGGISFATMLFTRQMLMIPGNPELNRATGGTPPAWQHYQSANWHSFLEQSQGIGFGVITAITMGLLWRKLKPICNEPRTGRWTEVVVVGLAVFFLTYVNVVKNVDEWTKKLVPALMKAPLIQQIELSATTWFNIAWCAISLAFVALMVLHQVRKLAIVPESWLGKGQLIYILILWIMVIADFERSLNGFHQSRLLTEWVIIINASLATFLVIALPREAVSLTNVESVDFRPPIHRTWIIGVVAASILMTLYANVIYKIYGSVQISGAQYRWGETALWRTKPILKNKEHR